MSLSYSCLQAIENSKWTSGDKENVVKDTLMSLAMGN